MYTDVEELYLGSADGLQTALRKAATSAATSPAASDTSFGVSSQNLPSSRATRQSTRGAGSDQSSTYIPGPGALTLQGDTPPLSQVASNEIYLMLCVKGRRLMELEQIKIMRDGDDQVIFQDIRRAYLKIRQQQARDFHPDTPEFVRKISLGLHHVRNSVQRLVIHIFECLRLGWLVWWIGDTVFYIPTTANFVRVRRFQPPTILLLNLPVRTCPHQKNALPRSP